MSHGETETLCPPEQRAQEPLLRIEGLRTHFDTADGVVKSVDGVDLSVLPGQTLCVVGESGCGKSVTARSMMQLVDPPGRIVDGKIWFSSRAAGKSFTAGESATRTRPRPGSGLRRLWRRGSDEPIDPATSGPIDLASADPNGRLMRSVRGSEISMVFQEPMASLSPVHTIGQQLVEMILLHTDLDADAAAEKARDSLAQVGMPNPAAQFDSYSFELSGGMRQRAMIAMAVACQPQLLIADEPTTALDVTTQRQILDLLATMQDELDMAMMFITHDLGVVAQIADRVAVMYLGMVIEECSVFELFESPRHPYTRALLESVPDLTAPAGGRLNTIRGSVPPPLQRPQGCPFVTRCDHAISACHERVPPMVEATRSPAGTDRQPRKVRCVHLPTPEIVAAGIADDLGPTPVAAGASIGTDDEDTR